MGCQWWLQLLWRVDEWHFISKECATLANRAFYGFLPDSLLDLCVTSVFRKILKARPPSATSSLEFFSASTQIGDRLFQLRTNHGAELELANHKPEYSSLTPIDVLLFFNYFTVFYFQLDTFDHKFKVAYSKIVFTVKKLVVKWCITPSA